MMDETLTPQADDVQQEVQAPEAPEAVEETEPETDADTTDEEGDDPN